MPVSNYDPDKKVALAVAAESLYLVNLMVLPGLGFLLIVLLYWKSYKTASALSLNHLQQVLFASVWAGVLVIVMLGLILLLGGVDGPYTWVIAIIYFTMAHSSFIILGMYGLVKAMAGECCSYPLVGRPIPEDC